MATQSRPSWCWVGVVLSMLWSVSGAAATVREPGTANAVFTDRAITTALLHSTVMVVAAQDPRSDWSRLRQFTNMEIVVFSKGLTGRRCRLVAVEDASLTVVDLEGLSGATLRIPRLDVSEVKQWTGRSGSRRGAIVGAAAGFALGWWSAVSLAYKQCGDSCADERILIGASLVGMPLAGGFLGYRLPGGNRLPMTIYIKS